MNKILIFIIIQILGFSVFGASRPYDEFIPIEPGCSVKIILNFSSSVDEANCTVYHNNIPYELTDTDNQKVIPRFEVNSSNDSYTFNLPEGSKLTVKFDIKWQDDIERTFENNIGSALFSTLPPSYRIFRNQSSASGTMFWDAELIPSDIVPQTLNDPQNEIFVLQMNKRPNGSPILEKSIYLDTFSVNNCNCDAEFNTTLAFINGFQYERYVSVRYIWGEDENCGDCLKAKYVTNGDFGGHFGAVTRLDTMLIDSVLIGDNILLMHEILHTTGLSDLCLGTNADNYHKFLNDEENINNNILCSFLRNRSFDDQGQGINMSVFQIKTANRLNE